VRSTARLFGGHVKTAVLVLYTLSLIMMGAALWGVAAGAVSYVGLAVFAAHLYWQIGAIDRADSARALMLFRSNKTAGLLLWAGLLIDSLHVF
jgi:4-hydroxybenzoate polyprenyltransferase